MIPNKWLKKVSLTQVILVGLILIGIGLRANYLNREMRYDESLSFLNYILLPLDEALSNYTDSNNHLFNTFWMHLSYTTLGNAPWILRLSAFVAGVLTIPAVFVVGRQFYGELAGLIAAALISASAVSIDYSVNARGYAMLTLLFVLLLGVAHILRTRATLPWWIAYAVLCALSFFTIPLAVYTVGSVSLWLLLSLILEQEGEARKQSLLYFAAALGAGAVLTLILYAPALLTTTPAGIADNSYVTLSSISLLELGLRALPRELDGMLNRNLPIWLAGILLICAMLTTLQYRKIRQHRVPLLIPMVLTLLAIIFAQRLVPPHRTWHYLVPVYFMLAGGGIAYAISKLRESFAIPQSWISGAVLLVAIFIGGRVVQQDVVRLSYDTARFLDAEVMALELGNRYQPGDMAIFPSLHAEEVRYYLIDHGYPDDWVFNTNYFEEEWLLDTTYERIYIWGSLALYQQKHSIEIEWQTEGQLIFGEAIADTPSDKLYRVVLADSFASDFEDNSSIIALEQGAELIEMPDGNHVLQIGDPNIWVTIPLSVFDNAGIFATQGYVLEGRLQIAQPVDDFADILINLNQSTPKIRHLFASMDSEQRAGIGFVDQEQFGGFLEIAFAPTPANAWVDFRLEGAVGRAALFVDGNFVTYAQDSDAELGTLTFTVPPQGIVLLDDIHFSLADPADETHAQAPTLTLQNVPIVDTFEGESRLFSISPPASEIVTIDGDNQVLRIDSGDNWTSVPFSPLANEDNTLIDYRIAGRLAILQTSADFEDVFIRFRVNDAGDSYAFSIDDQNHAGISYNIGYEWGGFLTLNGYDYLVGDWVDFEITVEGDRLVATLDGEVISTVQDSQITEGSIAIDVPPGAEVLLDDFTLEVIQ